MKLALLAGFLVCAGLAGILTTTILRVKEHNDHITDYGVILDAGSTATRAYIYQWSRKTSDTLPTIAVTVFEDEPCIKVIHPGIAEIDPSDVSDYLSPLLDWAHTIIPSDVSGSTPIFLRGTGGLRLLSTTQSSNLISAIQDTLRLSGFVFDSSYASILPGEQEAAFGFIAVNALYNKLGEGSDPSNTYGSLDMGGVSSEIAFVPSSNQPPVNYSFSVSINGTVYPIYVQSHDVLGLNQARYGFNISLYGNMSDAKLIFDPCLPSGYSENVTIIVNGQLQSFMLEGVSNPDQCWNEVESFVNYLTGSYPHPSVSSDMIFVASDKFTKVNDFYGLYEDASIAELEDSAHTFCALSYETAVQQHADYATTVQDYCFYGVYVAVLMQNFFGISPGSRNVLWQKQIGNSPVTWTLGAMVDYITALSPDTTPPPEHRVRFFQTDGGVVVLFVSILVLLLGIVLFILQRRRPTDYTPIRE